MKRRSGPEGGARELSWTDTNKNVRKTCTPQLLKLLEQQDDPRDFLAAQEFCKARDKERSEKKKEGSRRARVGRREQTQALRRAAHDTRTSLAQIVCAICLDTSSVMVRPDTCSHAVCFGCLYTLVSRQGGAFPPSCVVCRKDASWAREVRVFMSAMLANNGALANQAFPQEIDEVMPTPQDQLCDAVANEVAEFVGDANPHLILSVVKAFLEVLSLTSSDLENVLGSLYENWEGNASIFSPRNLKLISRVACAGEVYNRIGERYTYCQCCGHSKLAHELHADDSKVYCSSCITRENRDAHYHDDNRPDMMLFLRDNQNATGDQQKMLRLIVLSCEYLQSQGVDLN